MVSILLASATALPAENASLSGKWKVHTDIGGTQSDPICSFTQKDDELTGNCGSDDGDKPLTGKVDGKTITWAYHSEYEGTPLTVNYKGTMDATGAKLSGTVSVPEFQADGEFSAVPAK